jgi:hypothetical protein
MKKKYHQPRTSVNEVSETSIIGILYNKIMAPAIAAAPPSFEGTDFLMA